MNDNLKKLIDKINLEEKYYQYFNEAKLLKIICNSEKTNYTFFIEIKETLPVELYQHFIELLKETYNDIEKVIVVFQPLNIKNELINEYFKYLMERSSKKCPMLATFVDNNVLLDNKTLLIEVDNIAEQNKLISLEKTIVLNFQYIC